MKSIRVILRWMRPSTKWWVQAAPEWRAGVARTVITPTEPMYLAGFANRVVIAEGTAMDLHAKALAVEDAGGKRVVMVTLDLDTAMTCWPTGCLPGIGSNHSLAHTFPCQKIFGKRMGGKRMNFVTASNHRPHFTGTDGKSA